MFKTWLILFILFFSLSNSSRLSLLNKISSRLHEDKEETTEELLNDYNNINNDMEIITTKDMDGTSIITPGYTRGLTATLDTTDINDKKENIDSLLGGTETRPTVPVIDNKIDITNLPDVSAIAPINRDIDKLETSTEIIDNRDKALTKEVDHNKIEVEYVRSKILALEKEISELQSKLTSLGVNEGSDKESINNLTGESNKFNNMLPQILKLKKLVLLQHKLLMMFHKKM